MKATLTLAVTLVLAASASAALVDFTLTTDSVSDGNQNFTKTTDITQVVSDGISWNSAPASATFRAATTENDVARIVDNDAGDFLDLGVRAKSSGPHANIVMWDLGSSQSITGLSATTAGHGNEAQGAWVVQHGTTGVDAVYYVATFNTAWKTGTQTDNASALSGYTWNEIAFESSIESAKGAAADAATVLADATAVGIYYGNFGGETRHRDLKLTQFTAVPEPATMGLLGLGSLAFLKRRRS